MLNTVQETTHFHTFLYNLSVTFAVRWCLFLGVCTYDRQTAAGAVWLLHETTWGTDLLEMMQRSNASAIADLYRCWAHSVLRVGDVHEGGQGDEDTVHVFANAAAGVGPYTMSPFHATTMFVHQAPLDVRRTTIKYVREYVFVWFDDCIAVPMLYAFTLHRCAGLPGAPRPPPATPHVVLFNRAYTAGRGLLRVDQVAWKLGRVVSDTVAITVEFAEGLSFRGGKWN